MKILVYFLVDNLPFICQLYIVYDCPAKTDDGYEYKLFRENILANVRHLEDKVVEASDCAAACDKKTEDKGDTCDFFMYHHRSKRCIMWHFVRPSRVLQVGLMTDSIFCIKIGKICIANVVIGSVKQHDEI